MARKNRVHAVLVLAGITAVFAVPSTSVFTGFDGNPAGAATDAVTFDENPAADATSAVPERRNERPRIRQQSNVSANASTRADGNVDATQRTSAQVNDHLAYRPQRSFDNIFVRQDARTDIRQRCRVGGSCTQRARSDINQSADIPIQGRFTNVFVTQDAAARFDQDCRARGTCDQGTDSRFNQQTDFTGSHWSSNGFANRRRGTYTSRTTGNYSR